MPCRAGCVLSAIHKSHAVKVLPAYGCSTYAPSLLLFPFLSVTPYICFLSHPFLHFPLMPPCGLVGSLSVLRLSSGFACKFSDCLTTDLTVLAIYALAI